MIIRYEYLFLNIGSPWFTKCCCCVMNSWVVCQWGGGWTSILGSPVCDTVVCESPESKQVPKSILFRSSTMGLKLLSTQWIVQSLIHAKKLENYDDYWFSGTIFYSLFFRFVITCWHFLTLLKFLGLIRPCLYHCTVWYLNHTSALYRQRTNYHGNQS